MIDRALALVFALAAIVVAEIISAGDIAAYVKLMLSLLLIVALQGAIR